MVSGASLQRQGKAGRADLGTPVIMNDWHNHVEEAGLGKCALRLLISDPVCKSNVHRRKALGSADRFSNKNRLYTSLVHLVAIRGTAGVLLFPSMP